MGLTMLDMLYFQSSVKFGLKIKTQIAWENVYWENPVLERYPNNHFKVEYLQQMGMKSMFFLSDHMLPLNLGDFFFLNFFLIWELNIIILIILGAELAQLVRWMTLNQEVPGSNLDMAI